MAERFLHLKPEVLDKIRSSLRARPDVEHCGLLLASRGTREISEVAEYAGALEGRGFALPYEWLLQMLMMQRRMGNEIAGFYHTHPQGSTLQPSSLDRAGHPLGALVLIVNDHDHQAFRISTASGAWIALAI